MDVDYSAAPLLAADAASATTTTTSVAVSSGGAPAAAIPPSPQASGVEHAADHIAAADRIASSAGAAPSSAGVSAFAAISGAPTGSGLPSSLPRRPSDFQRLRSAVYEKHLKLKVALAVDHFNKDHKKGFQFLQVCGKGVLNTSSSQHKWQTASVGSYRKCSKTAQVLRT